MAHAPIKNMNDFYKVVTDLAKDWFIHQCRDCTKDYYLVYRGTEGDIPGQLKIVSYENNDPTYRSYQIASRIPRNMTVDQAKALIIDHSMKLPIMSP